MALQEFTGVDGRQWQVWETRPTNPQPAGDRVPGEPPASTGRTAEMGRFSKKREAGWLTFSTPNERRRLSPIPDEWETLDAAGLRALLAGADRVRETAAADEQGL